MQSKILQQPLAVFVELCAAASGWELISVPAQQWLDGTGSKDRLIAAIRDADRQRGSCGCDLDPLYRRAPELFSAPQNP